MFAKQPATNAANQNASVNVLHRKSPAGVALCLELVSASHISLPISRYIPYHFFSFSMPLGSFSFISYGYRA